MAKPSQMPGRIVGNPALTPREKLDLLASIRQQALEDPDYRVLPVAPDSIDAAMQQVRRSADAEPVGEIWRTS